MPHFGIKKCAKMGQPDKSYVNCALNKFYFCFVELILLPPTH